MNFNKIKIKKYQIQYELRMLISANYPLFFISFMRWRRKRGLSHSKGFDLSIVGEKNTDIVIDGYPRSANTFAFFAFMLAQSNPVKIAHHLHSPAQIIAAAKMNIPSLVLIRDPEDAVLSFVIYDGRMTVKQALRSYIYFYEPLIPYKKHFLVAAFDDVVTDFSQVIHKFNNKFGTNFDEFNHTEDNVKKVWEMSGKDRRDKLGIQDSKFQESHKQFESTVSHPSEERKNLKQALRQEFITKSLTNLHSRSYEIYKIFLSLANS